MKNKLIVLSAAFAAIIALASCGMEKGPVGPDAEGGFIMNFQNGYFPSSSYSGCVDTVIDEFDPNVNFSAEAGSYIGVQDGDRNRLLIKFDVSALPSSVSVTAAYITLKANDQYGSNPDFAFYKVKSAWTASQATWNSRQSGLVWATAGGEFEETACSNSVTVDDSSGAYMWNIDKAVVQGWLEGVNNGLIMKRTSESVEDSIIEFYMSDYGDTVIPKLTVIYGIP